MTLIFFLGGGGGEEVRWKTVRTYGKILATPLKIDFFWQRECFTYVFYNVENNNANVTI